MNVLNSIITKAKLIFSHRFLKEKNNWFTHSTKYGYKNAQKHYISIQK